jgi:hypothetical protein
MTRYILVADITSHAQQLLRALLTAILYGVLFHITHEGIG